MERTISYFERFGLFQSKNRDAQLDDATTFQSVATRVDEWYDSFWDIAMKYNEGNIQAAEHFMDTSVFMFYYRIKQKTAYGKWYENEMKQAG